MQKFAAKAMPSPSKKIVAIHPWRGDLVRVELSCGHFVEKSRSRIPKSNKLACADCAPITVSRVAVRKTFDRLRNLQDGRSEEAVDAIGDCIEELKALFGDGF
jgi:hypothetical protein